MPVPHADNPGMSWPRPVRIAWLITSITLSTAALLNLIYLVEAKSASATSIVAPSATILVTEAGAEHGDEVAVICDLIDVVCDGESVTAESTPPGIPRLESQTSPVKKGAPAWMQERIDYAWSKGKDLDFVLMLEVENAGSWAVDKLSDMVGANGYRDKGICQVNIGHHPEVVSDPRFKDWRWQVDTCWKMYKGGVRFYGHDVRYRAIPRFILSKN